MLRPCEAKTHSSNLDHFAEPQIHKRIPMTAPPAATITVRDTLALLDDRFASMAAALCEGRYVLWLGSGISLGRFGGIRPLVGSVIEHLRSRITPGNDNCPFNIALKSALALASVTPEEEARFDVSRPATEWTDLSAIEGRLANQYSRLLDITVGQESDDFLLWDGVKVVKTYADPSKTPDSEHVCIAILALEGVAPDIASANWDGLIEKAVDELTAGQTPIVVCVQPDDVRKPALRAWLYKFHGCAILAGQDETKYRKLLVARSSQIGSWAARNALMADKLKALIVSRPTLMLGLSAQDFNIQHLFAAAEAQMPWQWPSDPPAFVFSENALGGDQISLLKNVYRAVYDGPKRAEINTSALIQAYAKPLLIGLVLQVLHAKLQKLVELTPSLAVADAAYLKAGLLRLRNDAASQAGADQLAFVKTLIETSSRILTLFREGRMPASPATYQPVSITPVQQMALDPTLGSSGLREFAVALGLLGSGSVSGWWTISIPAPFTADGGVLRLHAASGDANVMFAANAHSALRLANAGLITESEESVMIHSAEIVHPMQRSPRAAPGRTTRPRSRQVSIGELLSDTSSPEGLADRFRKAVVI